MSGGLQCAAQTAFLAIQITLTANCEHPDSFGHGFFHGACVTFSLAFTITTLLGLKLERAA